MRGDREAIIAVLFCNLLPMFLLKIFNSGGSDCYIVLVGGLATFAFLPFMVQQICEGELPKYVINLIQFLSIFIFASGTDLIMALQNDGIIKNFVDFYFEHGEAYLKTPFSTVICYYDGIVHMAIYCALIYMTMRGMDHKPAAHFVVGSMVNSLVVLLVGSVLGTEAVKAPILLNIPYLVLPLLLWYLMCKDNSKSAPTIRLDSEAQFFYLAFFVSAIALAIVRALAALGGSGVFATYLQTVEPYLSHPTAYPKVQAMMYLFHFVPYYMLVIIQLVEGSSPSLGCAMVHAGAAVQAQVSHLGVFFKSDFDAAGQLPKAQSMESHVFWIINVALLVVPVMFAYQCYLSQSQPSSGYTQLRATRSRSRSARRN